MKSRPELPKQCNWELDFALIALDELKTNFRLELSAVPAVVRDFPEVTIVPAVTKVLIPQFSSEDDLS